MKKNLNQKLINLIEYYNLINNNLFLDNFPIKRNKTNISKSSNMTKVQKLKALKENIKLIKNCELKKNATNLVFGDGNIDSKVMILGEGPGAQEDAEGIPFVGRAGKLLDKILEEHSVFIYSNEDLDINFKRASANIPKVSILNHSLHFASSVFEGIRVYNAKPFLF